MYIFIYVHMYIHVSVYTTRTVACFDSVPDPLTTFLLRVRGVKYGDLTNSYTNMYVKQTLQYDKHSRKQIIR